MECNVFQHVSDDQWNRIRLLIPRSKPSGRDRRTEMRRVVDAIRHLRLSNISWRSLPEEYPPWRTVYGYYRQWSADGIWQQIEAILNADSASGGIAIGEKSSAARNVGSAVQSSREKHVQTGSDGKPHLGAHADRSSRSKRKPK